MQKVVGQMSNDPIVDFYRGEIRDTQGRVISEIWDFDSTRLEDALHYTEWLFPVNHATDRAPDAPLVTSDTQEAFKSSAELRDRLRRSLDLMLGFYGFVRVGEQVARGNDFESRRLGWLYPNDRSHRRMSRIVTSLALLGEPRLAASLRDVLVAIADEYGTHSVSAETRQRWSRLLET